MIFPTLVFMKQITESVKHAQFALFSKRSDLENKV